MSAVTQTIPRTIVGINPIGNNVWQIEFNPSQNQITSDVSTAPVIYYSSSALPVILNPFLNNIGNFNNSDYNAIINNAIFNRLSEWHQRVDYTNDQNIPVNFQQLISGTATPASVQDSNYTSYQYSGIRYIGSKNTTDNFNNASTTVSSNTENQTNTDLGNTTLGLPSVDLNRTYFAYFNWAGGTAPEWGTYNEDKTTYNIRYFVDESGNVIRPLSDSEGINLGIIRQNFTEGEIAVSALNNTNIFGTELSILNGEYPIFKSGKTIQPILYSQTQSIDNNGNVVGYGFTSSISFNVQSGTTSVPNYQFLASKNTTQTSTSIPLNTTNNIVLTFPNESYDYNANYNTGTSLYTFDSDTDVKVSFRASIRHNISFFWEDPFITPNQSMTVQFAIQKSVSGAPFTDLAVKNVLFNINTSTLTTTLATPFSFFNNGDILRVVMKTYNVTPNPFNETANMSFLANSTFSNFQDQGGFTVPTASVNYWTTGSTPSNILTASAELTNLYGYIQDSIYDSGFNPINYRFEIQPYDEIRFEAIEPNAYTIVSASFSDKLHLFLDRNITPPGTNINFFLIRIYVDDPAFITLDVDKPAGDSGAGILKPEYLLTRIEGKIDNILEDLQERGLIQE